MVAGSTRKRWHERRALAATVLLLGGGWAAAHLHSQAPPPLYADLQLTTDACTTYTPATRTCGAGSDAAYRTLAGASAAATRPGVVVWLRGGTYTEALVPVASGTADAPITFQAYARETPSITGELLDPAIDLSGRRYVVIDGITVHDVVAWLRGEDTHHTIVRNMTFRSALARGTRGGVKYVRGTFNTLRDNTLHEGNDNIMLVHSDRNIVEGNTVTWGRHSLWTILCGNFNVIRNNDLHNGRQKIAQVSDCEGVPADATPFYNATKRNLVEGNVFKYTPSSGGDAPYAGIQYSAQDGIVRRNMFYDMVGPAIQMTLYDAEARYNTGNRVYHNVFYGLQHAAIDIAGPGKWFSGNIFTNNVIYKNRFTRYAQELEGRPIQVLADRLDGYLFERNLILGAAPGERYAVSYGLRSGLRESARTLAWWQEKRDKLFVDNLDALPGFADEAARDFRPTAGSALVDAGAFLTKTTVAGSGTRLIVADASYFYDGFDIPGEQGDLIQLAGQQDTTRITDIDYATQTLTLDRALTWTAGQGVALSYRGTAPDIGAFEFGDERRPVAPPSPGSAVRR